MSEDPTSWGATAVEESPEAWGAVPVETPADWGARDITHQVAKRAALESQLRTARLEGAVTSQLPDAVRGVEWAAEAVRNVPATLLNLPYEAGQMVGLIPKEAPDPYQPGRPIVDVPAAGREVVDFARNAPVIRTSALGAALEDPRNQEIAAGTINAGTDLARGLTTPEMLPFLATGGAGPAIQRLAGAAFAGDMILHLPESAAHAGEVSASDEPLSEKVRADVNLGVNATLPLLIAAHGLSRARRAEDLAASDPDQPEAIPAPVEIQPEASVVEVAARERVPKDLEQPVTETSAPSEEGAVTKTSDQRPAAPLPLETPPEPVEAVRAGETITGSNERTGSEMPAEQETAPSAPAAETPPEPAKPARKRRQQIDRPPDIIDDIQGQIGGKLSLDSARKVDPYFRPTGAARALFSKSGKHAIDVALNALQSEGLHLDIDSQDGFLNAVQRAASARKAYRKGLSQEAKLAKFEMEQHKDFSRSAIEGRRTKGEPKAAEPIPVNDLQVGDEFTLGGAKVEVSDLVFDPDTLDLVYVELKDGKRFGVKTISGDEFIHPDEGSLKKTEVSTEFLPPEDAATPLEFKAESVEDQRLRQLREESARQKAEQQRQIQEGAAAPIIGKAVDTTGDLFGTEHADAPLFATKSPGELASYQQATLPRKIAPFETPKGDPISLAEIRQYLSNALDIPVRMGRYNRRQALGIFRVKPETVRLRALNDIPTLAHEVGHYLHQILFATSKFSGQFDGELLPLGKVTSRASYTKQQVRMEGVAEYLREYLTDRTQALAKAPRFTQFLEQALQGQFPETWSILSRAREMIARYVNQPSEMKIESLIARDARKPFPKASEILHNAATRWFNDLHPIERALGSLTKYGLPQAQAKAITTGLWNYIGGARSRVQHSLYHAQLDLKGNRIGPSLRDILTGLEDPAEFERYLVAKRSIEKAGQGKQTGIDMADARTVVSQLGTKYAARAQRLREFQRNEAKLLVESGVIAPDQFARMEQANQDYVPFYRLLETVDGPASGGARSGKGFADLPQGIGKFKGSDRQIMPPLESIVKNMYAFREIAERNQVMREFFDAVEGTQGGGRVGERIAKKIKPIEVPDAEIRQALENSGIDPSTLPAGADLSFRIWRLARQQSAKDGILTVWKNGKETPYQVMDGELYRAIKRVDADDSRLVSKYLKPLLVAKRALVAGATLTPDFGLARNPARDTIGAAVYSRHGFVPGYDTFRGVLHVLRKDSVYQDWLRGGGKFSEFIPEQKNLQAELARVIKDPTTLQKAIAMANPANALANLEALSRTLEQATRVSEFRRAQGQGKSLAEAANASKDVTLNFSRGGSYSKFYNTLSAFFNATLLDVDKFVRAHKEAPLPTAAKAFLWITAPSLTTWYLGKDDKRIQNLPKWRKQFFWNINVDDLSRRLGLDLKLGQGKDFVFSFPKPFLLGQVYGSAPEAALDLAYNKDPKAVNHWISGSLQTVTPSLLPTIALPLIENTANYSFFRGGPLESQSMQNLPVQYRSTPQTSQVANQVSAAASRIPFEFAQISPIKVDNLIRGYFAGLGKYGTDATDWLMAKTGMVDIAPPRSKYWTEFPVLRAVSAQPFEPSPYIQRFYEGARLGEQRLEVLRKGPQLLATSEEAKFIRENRADVEWYGGMIPAIRQVADGLSQINSAMHQVQVSRTLTPDDKRDRLLTLSKQRDRIAEAAFNALISPGDRKRVY